MGSKKHLSFFAVISLVSILFFAGFAAESVGVKSEGRSANQFGPNTKGKVWGDRLCVETGGRTLMPWEKEGSKIGLDEEISGDKGATGDMGMTGDAGATGDKNEIEKLNSEEETMSFEEILNAPPKIPVTIPLHQGYFMGKAVYYIITDSSDTILADLISENQEWKVNSAPPLANATTDAVSKTYMFTNGVPGDGVYGFQGEVFTNTPVQEESYSALTSQINVTWSNAALPMILDSEKEILRIEKEGLVDTIPGNVVLNMPQIVWPEGQMLVKTNKTITNQTTFVGGQVTDIDLENKTTTFIAHQGWSSQGETIYFIVTDATPIGPAKSMGVLNVPKNAALISNSAVADVFHFMNGMQGPGPLGFQAGISSSSPGDADYSPMSRIYFIAWSDESSTTIIKTTTEIDELEEAGSIRVDLAKPMNADHIVNSPIINPAQLELIKMNLDMD